MIAEFELTRSILESIAVRKPRENCEKSVKGGTAFFDWEHYKKLGNVKETKTSSARRVGRCFCNFLTPERVSIYLCWITSFEGCECRFDCTEDLLCFI
jgi:hypothetical protein